MQCTIRVMPFFLLCLLLQARQQALHGCREAHRIRALQFIPKRLARFHHGKGGVIEAQAVRGYVQVEVTEGMTDNGQRFHAGRIQAARIAPGAQPIEILELGKAPQATPDSLCRPLFQVDLVSTYKEQHVHLAQRQLTARLCLWVAPGITLDKGLAVRV
jgi:hypothetical protein